MDNNRLYVGNVAFQTTDEALGRAFSEFGEVVEARLVVDRESGRSRGFGFVVMGTAEAAQKAIQGMNGADLDGRTLRVNVAEERGARRGGGSFGGDRGGRRPPR
jgi:cold-inducible RNA-binding protein